MRTGPLISVKQPYLIEATYSMKLQNMVFDRHRTYNSDDKFRSVEHKLQDLQVVCLLQQS